jgi:hypothetical protein
MRAGNRISRNLSLLSVVSLHPIVTLVREWQVLNTGVFNRAEEEFSLHIGI